MKRCSRCKVEKDESEFYGRTKGTKDGLSSYCKRCNIETADISRRKRMKENKEAWDEYNRNFKAKWNKENKDKVIEYQKKAFKKFKDHARNLKIEAINYLGGSCSKCGYCKFYSALDFHHLDPDQKDDGIGNLIWKNKKMTLEKLKPELDKCVVLCKNCHAEEHNNW